MMIGATPAKFTYSGCTTLSAMPVATPASIALPPASRILKPASAARYWVAAIMWRVPMMVGRWAFMCFPCGGFLAGLERSATRYIAPGLNNRQGVALPGLGMARSLSSGTYTPPGTFSAKPLRMSRAMAPRANWKGYLKLSLVSCAVDLFPATSTRERVHLHSINRKTGNRVRYEVVDSETGDEIPQEDRVTGYKVDSNSSVLLEEGELDEVALESTHTIDIEAFIPREDVDDIYLDEWQYLVPR